MKNVKRIPVAGTARSVNRGARRRTTIVLPETVDLNLDVAAIREGRPKGDLICEAVVSYLADKMKLDPDRRPEISVSYK